jgi:HD-GYP domain-containing protein (c-di-GMP phosphodiesterase class II)
MVEDSLNDHEYFPNLGPIIRAHHERYDGSGYPAGMRGERIPKEARIISAAAAWCAMLSRRPWRAAMSHAAVAAYMRANAGTEFDPEMVELLTKLT